MEPQHAAPPSDEPAAIRDRSDTGGGWSALWPLLALALIGLMTVRACVPGLPAAPAAPTVTSEASVR